VQLTRFVAEVSAQVYEPAIDPDRLAAEESEFTPIFHALARHGGDPVEHFRRDPLGAPLPATAPAAPPMARMLLHSVPTDRPQHRRAAALSRPSHPDPAGHRAEEPGGARQAGHDAESGGGGGRHRALRSVGSASY